MIRIKPARRLHIPNRLALVGAVTLALTLFTGTNDTRHDELQTASAVTAEVTRENDSAGPEDRRKRFSVSRLLFGHG